MSAVTTCRATLAIMLSAVVFASAEEEKPKTLPEAKAAFTQSDKALNDAWATAKKALSESEFAELQIKQRDWMKFREDSAHGANPENKEPEAKETVAYYETAAELNESRASWLRGRIRNESDSLTGLWIDSFGGTLKLVQQKTRLLFMINVVRGPSFHFGSIAGVATWNPPLGWFSDKGRDKEKIDDYDESNLVFVERSAVLEIIGANTAYYHGARAYFDGAYCRVGDLDDKQKAEVIKSAESGKVPEK
jgi:uncharacterized protein YecT (DUF1311 family)